MFKNINKILDMAVDKSSQNYREVALKNTPSNHGWYTCPKCGKSFRASGMDADHILPKSCYGSNDRRNLQLLCAHCNRSKGNRTDDTVTDYIRNAKRIEKQDKEIRKSQKDFLKKMF